MAALPVYEIKDFDEVNGFVHIHVRGCFDAQQIVTVWTQIVDDPRWCRNMDALVLIDEACDLSALTMHAFQQTMLPAARHFLDKRGPQSRIAWVVPNPLSRSIATLWNKTPGRVGYFREFPDEASDRQWLAAENR